MKTSFLTSVVLGVGMAMMRRATGESVYKANFPEAVDGIGISHHMTAIQLPKGVARKLEKNIQTLDERIASFSQKLA